MTTANASLALLGRALLAFMFILSGFAKLGDVSGTMAYTASGGLPGFFAIPAMALEILGGLAILAGWKTRWAAFGLAAFSAATAVLFHYLPAQGMEGFERMAQMIQFQKNLTIAGGFLVLAAFGPGALSLDARTRRAVAA